MRAIVILILIFVPDQPPERQLRLHRAVQQLRLRRRQHERLRASGSAILPLRLPAHAVHDHRVRRLRPPVGGDRTRRRTARPRASGGRSSTRCIGGYILLLCVRVRRSRTTPRASRTTRWPAAASPPIFDQRPGHRTGRRSVLFISASAQFFCTTACMTSASRMTFAFSRDGAIPGSKRWSKLTAQPGAGQRGDAGRRSSRAILTLPALIKVDVNGDAGAGGVLRGHLDRGDRALPGLRDPDLPALAARATRSRSGSWNNGVEVQVDEPDRGRRDRHRVDLPDPAVRRPAATRSATTSSSGSSSTTRRS